MSDAWLLRKVRHVCDGGFLCRTLYFATVDSATSYPSKASSDLIRGTPHVWFSRDSRRMRSRTSRATPGLPCFLRDFHRQYSLKPCRCHRSTVSGWTRVSADRQPGQSLDSQTQKIRSCLRSLGRSTERRSTVSWCLRARFSATSAARSTKKTLRKAKTARMMPISAPPLRHKGQIVRSERPHGKGCKSFARRADGVFGRDSRSPAH